MAITLVCEAVNCVHHLIGLTCARADVRLGKDRACVDYQIERIKMPAPEPDPAKKAAPKRRKKKSS